MDGISSQSLKKRVQIRQYRQPETAEFVTWWLYDRHQAAEAVVADRAFRIPDAPVSTTTLLLIGTDPPVPAVAAHWTIAPAR